MKRILDHTCIAGLAGQAACQVLEHTRTLRRRPFFYGHPRGGIPALYAVLQAYNQFEEVHRDQMLWPLIVETPQSADILIDDLVDSGKTLEHLEMWMSPTSKFFALITKGATPGFPMGDWIVFPWEHKEESSIEDSFIRLFQYIGEDPKRGGLLETPARMAKAWKFWTSGYNTDPLAVLKTFEDGSENYDELVHVKRIPFYSQCEHHLAPFFGTVSFGYIPDKRIVGLSKMNRLVDVFARRLQVQERLTSQVIDTFCQHLNPLGAGIVVTARHLCMESRGVCHQGCVTTTSAFRGVIKDQVAARAEFFSLTNAL